MIVLFLILGILCIWRIQFSGYHEDFLSQNFTTPIKGIFTLLILFSHIRGYLTLSDSWMDCSYNSILDHLGQLTVAIFFFYSGFGIWESFKNRVGYQRTFLKNRFLKTLVHFDIAVAVFVFVQLIIPITYSTRQYMLCWIGWESVGNSNWFIFVILCLYLIAWAAMYIHSKVGRGGILLTFLLTAVLWICLRLVARQPSWWVDTMAVFPLGMILSEYKGRLYSLLRHKGSPLIISGVAIIATVCAYKLVGGIDIYGGVSCLFCCVVVLLSSWIKIGNPILDWLGKNAFTIYIIQRLPMIVLSSAGLNSRTWLFVMLVLPITFILAELLSRLNSIIDTRFFSGNARLA